MVQSPSWEANWFADSQEIPAFHSTRRFITALTSVRHLSLSWASLIQSTYPHPTSWRFSLILSTHLRLRLPIGLFPYGFPTKTLYTLLSSPILATCPAHLILLDFITRTILGELYKSFSSSLCNLLHSPVTSYYITCMLLELTTLIQICPKIATTGKCSADSWTAEHMELACTARYWEYYRTKQYLTLPLNLIQHLAKKINWGMKV